MRRRVSAILLTMLALAPALRALHLEPLRGSAATLHWGAPQFVQADARGDVFLLRGDTLQVYPVLKTHELGEPVRLVSTTVSGPSLLAAMNGHGDWVVAFGVELHRFVDGKEKAVLPALPWFPAGLGFVRDEPVALVVPPRLAAPAVGDDSPPVMLRAGTDAWTAELREPLHGAADDSNNEMLFRAARVLDARGGRYFLARQYSYRIELRRLGRQKPLSELRVGNGRPFRSKDPGEDAHRLLATAKAEGSDLSTGKASAFHGSNAILALAQGRADGRLYVLDGPGIAGEQCSLDRIDWERRRVERTHLDLPCQGQVSMAAGRDGLYFARFSGEAGRYFASWDAVEAGRWTPVEGSEFTP